MGRSGAERHEKRRARQGCVLSITRQRFGRELLLNISGGLVSSIVLLTRDAPARDC
jgi:hypothetical protein